MFVDRGMLIKGRFFATLRSEYGLASWSNTPTRPIQYIRDIHIMLRERI